jgi:uncharacterized protein
VVPPTFARRDPSRAPGQAAQEIARHEARRPAVAREKWASTGAASRGKIRGTTKSQEEIRIISMHDGGEGGTEPARTKTKQNQKVLSHLSLPYVPLLCTNFNGHVGPGHYHISKHKADPYHSGANICAFLSGSLVLLLMMHTGTVARAQPANPSFDCRRARDLDERAICSDGRLAELDQAVAIAYAQASKDPNFKQEARETAKETLAARHSCGDNRICILDQQVRAIDSYSGLGSKVPVPPWVGRYRIDLFESGSEPPTKNLPGRIGQCTTTKIASISTRFGEELKPPADELESSGRPYPFPKDCPHARGKFYSATNLRTQGSWLLPDAQHMCGGA